MDAQPGVRAAASPPVAVPRPAQTPHPVQKTKPDPRPARLVLGAAGVAAASALAAAIVLPPRQPGFTADVPDATQVADTLGSPLPSAMRSGVLYVVLAPGQTAPSGATVVDVTPTPRSGGGGTHAKKGTGGGTVATNGPLQPQQVKTAPAPTPTPKLATPTPVKTSQSGKKP